MAQRRHYKQLKDTGKSSKMDAARLQRLHEIGFRFPTDRNYKKFDERIEELKAYMEVHGHVRVPTNTPGGIGNFVATCREMYRQFTAGNHSTLDDAKIQKLRDLGFEFQVGKRRPDATPRKTWEGKNGGFDGVHFLYFAAMQLLTLLAFYCALSKPQKNDLSIFSNTKRCTVTL
jgi:hypothetical protein